MTDELAIVVHDEGGICPVQIEGRVNGLPFYFRARGQAWQVHVAQTPKGSVFNKDAWSYVEEWGDEPYDAGHMPLSLAHEFLKQALTAWNKERKNDIA